MISINQINSFEELNKFPLDGYKSDISYHVEKEENENIICFKMIKEKRVIPFIKKWEPFIEDKKRLDSIIKKGNTFGLYEDGIIIGIIVLQKYDWNNCINIEQIEVLSEKRGNGFGSLLMRKIDEIANINNISTITLETQTTNGKAIQFYKKHGYEIEGIDLSLYSNNDIETQEIAVIMKKKFT